MIHSGINAYLTLDIAQTLLRAGDPRYRELIETVAGLASPTGQWPEAIHPHTGGGCMGDGQHGWAAAEWVMMIRNCFVREEGDRLIIGSGLFAEWLDGDDELSFGPTLTPWGRSRVAHRAATPTPTLAHRGALARPTAAIDVAIPGFAQLHDVDATSAIRWIRPRDATHERADAASPRDRAVKIADVHQHVPAARRRRRPLGEHLRGGVPPPRPRACGSSRRQFEARRATEPTCSACRRSRTSTAATSRCASRSRA